MAIIFDTRIEMEIAIVFLPKFRSLNSDLFWNDYTNLLINEELLDAQIVNICKQNEIKTVNLIFD